MVKKGTKRIPIPVKAKKDNDIKLSEEDNHKIADRVVGLISPTITQLLPKVPSGTGSRLQDRTVADIPTSSYTPYLENGVQELMAMSVDEYDRRHMKHSGYFEGSGTRFHNALPNGKYYPGNNNYYGFDKDILTKKQNTESHASKPPKEPKETRDVFIRFAEHTSLHAFPFIKRAAKWYAKVLWTLFFLAATAAWIFHSTYLIQNYLKFATSSSVEIVYASAPFPSVSFCNINPVREVQLPTYGSAQLNSFMQSLKPKEAYQGSSGSNSNNPTGGGVTGGTNTLGVTSASVTGAGTGNGGVTNANGGITGAGGRTGNGGVTGQRQTTPSNTGPGRRKLLQTETGNEAYFYQYSNYQDQSQMYISNGGINWTEIAGEASDYANFIADTSTSATAKTMAAFKEIVSNLPDRNRTQLGHRLSSMMLSCAFNGVTCTAKDFTRSLDTTYGNCWTYNSDAIRNQSLMAVRGGSTTGLDIVLNIETNQHIKGLNIGTGIRMELHPFGTLPFIEDNGFSISPGKQTYVGIRMINQTRLGGNYGTCNDDKGTFRKYYNNAYIYTLEACIHTCLDRTIVQNCNCFRKIKKQLHPMSVLKTSRPCVTPAETQCVSNYVDAFAKGNLTCGCNQGCNSIEYDTMLTTDVWPDATLWFSLVDAVCVRDKTNCDFYQSVNSDDFTETVRNNFIHLKLYYRDLNVQNIKESAQYEFPQFGSDIGGAVGLWLGASIITLLELFDLSCQVCRFCSRKKKYKARKEIKNIPNYEQRRHEGSVEGQQHRLPRMDYDRHRYTRDPYNYI